MSGNWNATIYAVVLAGTLAIVAPSAAFAQLPEPGVQSSAPNPLSDTTVNPGKVLLFDLEARFAKDVAARGGVAFADWFAGDGSLARQWRCAEHRQGGHRQVSNLVAERLSTDLDPHRRHDGPVRRYGLHLGPLRGAQQGRQRQPDNHFRALHHDVAQGTRRNLEGGTGRRRKRAALCGRLLQIADDALRGNPQAATRQLNCFFRTEPGLNAMLIGPLSGG